MEGRPRARLAARALPPAGRERAGDPRGPRPAPAGGRLLCREPQLAGGLAVASPRRAGPRARRRRQRRGPARAGHRAGRGRLSEGPVHDALIALPFGLAIGILLGLVGAGGSILAVPVLVYVLGEPVKQATTESLLIVGLTALAGALTSAREHRVRWRVGLAFAAAGAAAAVVGTALNRLVGSSAILLGFGALLLAAAYAMTRAPDPRVRPPHVPARIGAAGAATGLLTGFFGVGGGFLIVPALTLGVCLPLALAVGTSLLVITLTSTTALAAHLASGGINVSLSAGFAGAAVAGAVAGSRLHARVREPVLRSLFAALLLAVGLAVTTWNLASIL